MYVLSFYIIVSSANKLILDYEWKKRFFTECLTSLLY